MGKLNCRRAICHLALGRANYAPTLELQRALHAKRAANEIADCIVTVEHNPVFTIGRSGSRDNVLVPDSVLDEQSIAVVEVERGGDITYHGPGQLVVYPILDLRGHGKDIHRYIRVLEEAIILTLRQWAVDGERRPGLPGVWVADRKIASIGVYVKNWVTLHGLALNVDINQSHFRMIRPCGLSVETVSMSDLCPESVELPSVRAAILEQLAGLLEREIIACDRKESGEIYAKSSVVD